MATQKKNKSQIIRTLNEVIKKQQKQILDLQVTLETVVKNRDETESYAVKTIEMQAEMVKIYEKKHEEYNQEIMKLRSESLFKQSAIDTMMETIDKTNSKFQRYKQIIG